MLTNNFESHGIIFGWLYFRTNIHVTPAITAMADIAKLSEVTTGCLCHNFPHFVNICLVNIKLSVHNPILQ